MANHYNEIFTTQQLILWAYPWIQKHTNIGTNATKIFHMGNIVEYKCSQQTVVKPSISPGCHFHRLPMLRDNKVALL